MTRPIYRVELSGRDATGAVTTFHFASEAIATGPAHPNRPNLCIEGLLTQPLLFRRDMYGQQGATRGAVQLAHGEIVLANPDGALDWLLTYGIDAQPVLLYETSDDNLNVETLIFDGQSEQPRMTYSDIGISVRERLYALDIAFQPTKFAGTNVAPAGLEGLATDIGGHPKPYLLGVNKNIEPILVNAPRLIYQINDTAFLGLTPTYWTIAVYDRGAVVNQGSTVRTLANFNAAAVLIAVTADPATEILTTAVAHGYATGDALTFNTTGTLPAPIPTTYTYWCRVLSATTFTIHPTQADATANTNITNITSTGTGTHDVSNNRTAQGCFDVCNDSSGVYIRLGATPLGQLTADVTASATGGVKYVHSIATAAMQRRIGYTLVFDAGAPLNNAGMYITEEITVFGMLQHLLQSSNFSFGAYTNWHDSYNLYLRVARAEVPSGTPVLTVTEAEIVGAPTRMVSPDPERGIPAWRVNVNYARARKVQTATDLSGAGLTRLAEVSNEYRTATDSDATVKNQYPASPEVNVDTELADAASAALLATYFLNLYKVRRDVFVVTVPLSLVRGMLELRAGFYYVVGPVLGEVVQLQLPRFGLSAGKLFRLMGLQVNLAAQTAELTLWG